MPERMKLKESEAQNIMSLYVNALRSFLQKHRKVPSPDHLKEMAGTILRHETCADTPAGLKRALKEKFAEMLSEGCSDDHGCGGMCPGKMIQKMIETLNAFLE